MGTDNWPISFILSHPRIAVVIISPVIAALTLVAVTWIIDYIFATMALKKGYDEILLERKLFVFKSAISFKKHTGESKSNEDKIESHRNKRKSRKDN